MSNLKRLWDTEGKKVVRAIPTGDPHKKLQVWTNDDGSKLYVYDIAGWREIAQSTVDAEEYGPVWKELDDEMVGYYLTNVPTNLYHRDQGDEAYYQFLDYDDTVLKSGTVEEGETPEAPADPTREATAQYTYTFAGWQPEVGPITTRTTYKATYTRTVNDYNVTIESNDSLRGTVDVSEVVAPYGTAISVSDNVLTIGSTTITATAEEGNHFVQWWGEDFGPVPSTVTDDTTIEAEFMENEGGNYLEWLNKVDDEHYNECVTILMEGDGTWYIDPEVFKSYTDLLNTSYTISDTAEGVDDSDITITLGENEDPDTMDAFPYVCNASYSGDLSGFDPDAYVATITIQDISGEEAVDIGTLTLNKTGA